MPYCPYRLYVTYCATPCLEKICPFPWGNWTPSNTSFLGSVVCFIMKSFNMHWPWAHGTHITDYTALFARFAITQESSPKYLGCGLWADAIRSSLATIISTTRTWPSLVSSDGCGEMSIDIHWQVLPSIQNRKLKWILPPGKLAKAMTMSSWQYWLTQAVVQNIQCLDRQPNTVTVRLLTSQNKLKLEIRRKA